MAGRRLKNSPIDPWKKGMRPDEMRNYDVLRTLGTASDRGKKNPNPKAFSPDEAREYATNPSGRLSLLGRDGSDETDLDRLRREVDEIRQFNRGLEKKKNGNRR